VAQNALLFYSKLDQKSKKSIWCKWIVNGYFSGTRRLILASYR
jgi:hypothetical protein